MRLQDPVLEDIVQHDRSIIISGKWFKVRKSPTGSCDNCYFLDKEKCPVLAVTMCCSNGGNIFELDEEKNKQYGR